MFDSELIETQLPLESQLAEEYYRFLMRVDPMRRWADIQTLVSPIETKSTFQLDDEQIAKVTPLFPGLASELAEAEAWGTIASALGFRYAWTRIHMHVKALAHTERILAGKNVVIEPGIGAGGLIHFLPIQHDLTYFGIDCSPQALDVCRKLEQTYELAGRRRFFRANFYAFHANHLTQLNIDPQKTVVLFSNFLSNGNSIWHTFPCVEPFIVAAWLVSYWVNAGATVLICERCDDGDSFVRSLVDNGRWSQAAQANVLDEFETYSTYESSIANPVGLWRKSKCVIASFRC